MIIAREDIGSYAELLRRAGQRIVLTNGCFDILHAGHVRYLADAKREGDVLIVGLNADTSVKKLKGPERPINSESDRAAVLDALKSVDAVVVFTEDTAEELCRTVRPDVYAKGGDYTMETLPEARIVTGYGGRVAFIPFLPGHSTSAIIERVRTAP